MQEDPDDIGRIKLTGKTGMVVKDAGNLMRRIKRATKAASVLNTRRRMLVLKYTLSLIHI